MFDTYGPIMTVNEVCEELMISKNTVYALLKSGKLESIRNGRTWKIKRDGLERYILSESGLLSSSFSHEADQSRG